VINQAQRASGSKKKTKKVEKHSRRLWTGVLRVS